jgi:CBS domain-containing protein
MCDNENIEGADVCEECNFPLDDLSLPPPTSEIEKALLSDRVAALKPRPALTVGPHSLVGEVLQFMLDQKVGSVIVIDEDRQPVGIFSERDALFRLNTDAAWYADRPVSHFMTPRPQCLTPDAKIAFAVQRMDQGSYRHVPIVDAEGRLTGVISVRDILRYLTAKMRIS